METFFYAVPPSWLLAFLLAACNVFVFRVILGHAGRSALSLLPAGLLGFALGNLLASLFRSPLPGLGDVHVIEASAMAWLALLLMNLRRPAEE